MKKGLKSTSSAWVDNFWKAVHNCWIQRRVELVHNKSILGSKNEIDFHQLYPWHISCFVHCDCLMIWGKIKKIIISFQITIERRKTNFTYSSSFFTCLTIWGKSPKAKLQISLLHSPWQVSPFWENCQVVKFSKSKIVKLSNCPRIFSTHCGRFPPSEKMLWLLRVKER